MRLLLIEHDTETAGWLAPRLDSLGFRTATVCDAQGALRDSLRESAAAVLIAIGNDSVGPCNSTTALRSAGLTVPVVIVSTRSDWRETVASLDAGADDFIVMPARSEEIAARLRAVIRRSRGLDCDRLRSGEFELDLNARCAWLRGQCLDLTRNEFIVLRLLLLNSGKVVSHDTLRAELSPRNNRISLNAIEVQIARLRKKIGTRPIRTVRSFGYRYVEEPSGAGDAMLESCMAGGRTIAESPVTGEGAAWQAADSTLIGQPQPDCAC